MRKLSTITFTSKNRTLGNFDPAGFSWHSRTFLAVGWISALGPFSREKHSPRVSCAGQGWGRHSSEKESPHTGEPFCTQALLIYCHIKLPKCRRVLRAGWEQMSLSLWPGSKPEGISNSTFWEWALLGQQSRAQPMLLITGGTGGSLGTSFRICPPIPTANPRKCFLFSREGPLSCLWQTSLSPLINKIQFYTGIAWVDP